MKKFRLTFILAISIGLLQSTVSATNYSCDFESPQDSDRWTVVTGTNEWNIVPGFSGNVFYLTMVSYGENLLTANDVTAMTDGIASADIVMHSAIGGSATGILVRYVDANNYYMYRLNYSEGKVQLYKKVNGSFSKISEATVPPLQLEQVYNLKVKIEGQSFTCYIDDVERIVATDAAMSSGGLGFRVYDQSVSIDNVLIAPVGGTTADPILEKVNVSVLYNKSDQKIEITAADAISDIYIFNTSGSLLKKTNTNNSVQTISVADWSNGVYIIRISSLKGEAVKKIIKF